MSNQVPEVQTESAISKFCLLCGIEGLLTGSVHHQGIKYIYGRCSLFHIGDFERIEIYRENIKLKLGLITDAQYSRERKKLIADPFFREYSKKMGWDPDRTMNDQFPPSS